MIKLCEPKVYLVGKQVVADGWKTFCKEQLGRSEASLYEEKENAGGPAEELCEMAGRLCYMSFGKGRKGNREYLAHIIESGHGSVAEHAVFNFIFTGISRSLTHELVRHRAGFGFSQLSQRYVDESVAEYVVPPDLVLEVECARHNLETYHSKERADAEHPRACQLYASDINHYVRMRDAGALWLHTIESQHGTYTATAAYLARKAEAAGLVGTEARKFARQAARSVLPNATETKIFVTMNARAARHFVEMRASRHADPEIRRLALMVLHVLKAEAPNLFVDYELAELPDGSREAVTNNRKV